MLRVRLPATVAAIWPEVVPLTSVRVGGWVMMSPPTLLPKVTLAFTTGLSYASCRVMVTNAVEMPSAGVPLAGEALMLLYIAAGEPSGMHSRRGASQP